MNVRIVVVPVSRITDWNFFHDVFAQTLGFPGFYGRNINAWIDCMTYLDASDDQMTAVTVDVGGIVVLQIENAAEFKARCPEQYDALIDCSAFVNWRRAERWCPPVLALTLIGA